MRGRVAWVVIVCLSAFVALAGCKSERRSVDAGSDPLRLRDGGGLLDGGPVAAGVRGVVSDVFGNRISGAVVAVGTTSTSSDSSGRFVLVGLPLQREASLTAQLWGYSTGHVPVQLDATISPYVKVVLQRAELVDLLDPSRGGEVRTEGGTVIELPPDAVVDDSGELVRGPISISVASINDRDEMAAAPGRALAVDPQAELRELGPLESFGMVEIGVRSRGERVQLREGMEVALSFPMTLNHPFGAGDSVALWDFDETMSAWTSAGDGVVDSANRVTARVGHFSILNAGRKLSRTCALGRVVDADGAPMAGLNLMAEGRSYLEHTRTTSDSNGDFCLEGRVSSVLELSALVETDGIDRALAALLDTPSAPGNCGQPDTCYKLPRELVLAETERQLCDPTDCAFAPAGTEACCITDLGPCSLVIHGDCGGSVDGAWEAAPEAPGVEEIPGVPLGVSPNGAAEFGTNDGGAGQLPDAAIAGSLDASALDAGAMDASAAGATVSAGAAGATVSAGAEERDGGSAGTGAMGPAPCSPTAFDAGESCDEYLDGGAGELPTETTDAPPI